MKRNRSLSLLLLCALVLALLAGCGGSAASGGKDSYTEVEAEEAYDAGMTSTENTAAPASPASGDGEGSGDPLPGGLKLVYTGSVTIDSTDYDATVADVRKLIADYGCLVEQANESDYDRTWRDAASSVREHTWTLRVPSEKFSALLESFGTVHGHVSDKNQSARDMTKQYRDNESRIASLKAQETRLLAFMDQAASISELMEVEDRLSEVRYELEQLQNDNNTIDPHRPGQRGGGLQRRRPLLPPAGGPGLVHLGDGLRPGGPGDRHRRDLAPALAGHRRGGGPHPLPHPEQAGRPPGDTPGGQAAEGRGAPPPADDGAEPPARRPGHQAPITKPSLPGNAPGVLRGRRGRFLSCPVFLRGVIPSARTPARRTGRGRAGGGRR